MRHFILSRYHGLIWMMVLLPAIQSLSEVWNAPQGREFPASGPQPTSQEFEDCRKYVSSHIEGARPASELKTGMVVIESNSNINWQRNGRDGQPLRIGGAEFRKGMFSHANCDFLINLPAPARSFTAVVGIDSAAFKDTGWGSVVFIVEASGQELYKSPVMHEGIPGASVNVDLGGAVELTLRTTDSGDGIGNDHSAWGDAKVTLEDGRELWIGDLPLLGEWAPLIDTTPPFSFVYDGKDVHESLGAWETTRTKQDLDEFRIKHVVTWKDPSTQLAVRLEAIEYRDFPIVEWTVYLTNQGSQDTPIIEDIQALDLATERGPDGKLVLNYHTGGHSGPEDFEPLRAVITKDFEKEFTCWDGFPTANELPFFNLERTNAGLIVAAGWPGRWAGHFTCKAISGMNLQIGQDQTHLRLHPGEEIRTPLIALEFWRGPDRIRSQNLWRRWMIMHNLPRPGGKLPEPMFCGHYPALETSSAEKVLACMDQYLQEGLKPDYWWIDAGWYPNKGGDWQQLLGTWVPDPVRFPKGLRGVFDYAHEKGIKSIVWFEPERVQPGSWLYENHPEWLLGSPGGTRVFNHGNPEAHAWIVDYMDKFFTEQGIDLYRQDFACFPMNLWKAADTEDRQGITENCYVVGYLRYLDELLERHPNLLIDICAAGGKRLELENLRRAVPLWRSDLAQEPLAMQSQTYGLAHWLPFFGTAAGADNPYAFYSNMCPSNVGNWNVQDKSLNFEQLRRFMAQRQQVIPYYYGEYYPLTPYSRENHIWMAWQFHRSDLNAGMIQVFRRGESFYLSSLFTLYGLVPECEYILTDLNNNQTQTKSGKELMETGIEIDIATKPGAVLIAYKQK